MQETPLHDLAGSFDAERAPYAAPVVKTLGDVLSLTRAEYAGLSQDRFGFYFAMASAPPGPPPAPVR